MTELTRRGFGAGALATLLAGCGPNTQSQSQSQPSSERLATQNEMIQRFQEAGVRFVDQHGNEVNLRGLQEQLKGNYSTLSFMLNGCVSGMCNLMSESLALASQQNPALKHVVVSCQGYQDYQERALAQTMEQRGTLPDTSQSGLTSRQYLRTSGPDANTIILFPTTDGTANPRALTEGMITAMTLQHDFSLITIGDDPQGHSGSIMLFNPQGSMVTRANGSPLDVRDQILEHISGESIAR